MDRMADRGNYTQDYSIACVLSEMGYESGPKEARNMGLTASNTKEAQRLCGVGYLELKEGNYVQARQYFIKSLMNDPFLPGAYEGIADISKTKDHLLVEYLPDKVEAEPVIYRQTYKPRKGTRQTRRPVSGGVVGRPTKKGHSRAVKVSLNLGLIGVSLGIGQRRTLVYSDPPRSNDEGDGSLRQKVYPMMP